MGRALLHVVWLGCIACGSAPTPEPEATPTPAPPTTSEEVRVLVVYGGAVGLAHGYLQTAIGMLEDFDIDFDVVSLPEYLSQQSALSETTFAAVVFSDYGIWRDHPDVAPHTRALCAPAACGVLFVYFSENQASDFGVTSGPQRSAVSTQGFGNPAGFDLIARDAGGVPITDPFFAWGTPLLSAHADSMVFMTANFAEGGGGISAVGVPATDNPPAAFFAVDWVDHWAHRLLFHDALSWITGGRTSIDKTRWIAVDIDDVFQPNWSNNPALRTVKMQVADVDALLELSGRLDTRIEGPFRFALGFNSGFYETVYGPAETTDDVAGDHRLIEKASLFDWFDHLPQHNTITGFDEEQIAALLAESQAFADEHGLELLPYSVTPRHQGIADLYVPLYDAWSAAGVKTTSAPLFHPAFDFHGVKVAPRLSCGDACGSEFASFSDIPAQSIDDHLRTALLPRVLRDKMLIFVSHQNGFARDRVAGYAFESLLDIAQAWTTLEFASDRVDALVELAHERGLN